MKHLDNITIRTLSDTEQAQSWNAISAQLATTPAQSPWFIHRSFATSLVVACLVLITTVGIADTAKPGDALFALDTGTERTIALLYPSTRARHAHERVEEFERIASTAKSHETFTTNETAEIATFKSAPAADMALMSMSGAVNEEAERTLEPHLEVAIEQTRTELNELLARALLENDAETADAILASLEVFEEYVATLRRQ